MASVRLIKVSDLKITSKLAIVAAVPIVTIIALFTVNTVTSWLRAGEAREIAAIAHQMPDFGHAVHQLQKERGASALFIGAKGQSFAAELTSQRQQTDTALAAFDNAFRSLDAVERASPMLARRPAIESALGELRATRQQVDALSIPVADAAGRYSTAIIRILALIGSVADLASDRAINVDARAYAMILEGKERAGLERALGSNGLAAGRFEATLFRNFIGLGTAQNLLFEQFRSTARPELVTLFDAALAAPVSQEVEAIRRAAYWAPFGGDISQIAAPDWFRKTTERINLLKTVEDKASATLAETALRVAGEASNQLFISIALAAGVLLASLSAVALMARNITRPIGEVVADMEALARGVPEVSIAGADRKDEIGAMAVALKVFQTNIQRIRALEEQERAAAAARLARAQSMEAVVSDVGEVVAAAAAGDFSARLQIDHADEQMQKLVSGINQINAVVDGATSDFSNALQAIAAGDLTHHVETTYYGRFADLKTAINDTVERLSSTVKTIQLTSVDVGLAAREINMGADDLSKRTEEQASSLEETAATTEELAASVKATAQASRQAATVADEAMQAAQNGGAIADEAVEAMARIENASQKISDIIRVIDDIAFQTNLLALNAAVESARAGDAGKGFAVVASEVRTLAQRSSEAAKDISALISSSNIEVGQGVKLVRQAGDQLSLILASSQKVAATIAYISAATSEQANGIDAMSQAVAHLDEMTQANAALAEESAASATSLTGRIAQLNDLVAAFKTGNDKVAGGVTSLATSEPTRLRQLAHAAFAQKSHGSRALDGASATPRQRMQVKRAVNDRTSDANWEEF
nr:MULTISPECIES: nitrate- and nitrite sensing domain-containing protein [unclassified Bradyrhizobium]